MIRDQLELFRSNPLQWTAEKMALASKTDVDFVAFAHAKVALAMCEEMREMLNLLDVTLKANSFACSECRSLCFGKPGHIHQASGEDLEAAVCRDCVDKMQSDEMLALMGGE